MAIKSLTPDDKTQTIISVKQRQRGRLNWQTRQSARDAKRKSADLHADDHQNLLKFRSILNTCQTSRRTRC